MFRVSDGVAALDERLEHERAGADRVGEERGLALPPKSFGKIALANTEMSDRNGAQGWESSKVTVLDPLALSDLMAKSRKLSGPAESVAARWIENTTSAGVTGLPSENLTPGRRAKVQVLPSELTVWPCASQGIRVPWRAGDVEGLEDLVEGVDVALDDRVGRVELGRARLAAEVQRAAGAGRAGGRGAGARRRRGEPPELQAASIGAAPRAPAPSAPIRSRSRRL